MKGICLSLFFHLFWIFFVFMSPDVNVDVFDSFCSSFIFFFFNYISILYATIDKSKRENGGNGGGSLLHFAFAAYRLIEDMWWKMAYMYKENHD